MTYTAIDGDIADFLGSMIDITREFRTEELRRFLLNEGHTEAKVVDGIRDWQANRFQQIDPS